MGEKYGNRIIKSNAGTGTARGAVALYPGSSHTQSRNSLTLARLTVQAIAKISGYSSNRSETYKRDDNGEFADVRDPKAPSILLEVGFHDNTEDVAFIINKMDNIAQAIVDAVDEFFLD